MIDFKECGHLARMYVCGSKMHSKTKRWEPIAGGWHTRFRGHPWVEQSIDEGWGRELRSALVLAVTGHMSAGRTVPDIERLMPDLDFIAAARAQAERFRLAREWQQRCIDAHGSMDGYWQATRGMRRYSDLTPRPPLPVPKPSDTSISAIIRQSTKKIDPDWSETTLTPISRRMSGDDA